jgi:hypothetical protein
MIIIIRPTRIAEIIPILSMPEDSSRQFQSHCANLDRAHVMFYEYRLQEIKANRKRVLGSAMIYSRQDVARDEVEATGCRSRISGGSFNRDNCQTLFILLAAAVRWHKLERVNKQRQDRRRRI